MDNVTVTPVMMPKLRPYSAAPGHATISPASTPASPPATSEPTIPSRINTKRPRDLDLALLDHFADVRLNSIRLQEQPPIWLS